jgi:putative transposase
MATATNVGLFVHRHGLAGGGSGHAWLTLRPVGRLPRYVFPDGTYHVGTRGVAKTAIFLDDADRRFFLSLFADVVVRNKWLVHSFCLMTTHYHLVVETLRTQLSGGLHRLNGTYAQTFNRRYRRTGHLFGDRFWSGLIEGDAELVETCRYVLANPVRAGMCAEPADWPWSGSRAGLDVF